MPLGREERPPGETMAMQSGSWEVTFVCVEDALDLETVAPVKARLAGVLERGGDVVLDLRHAVVDSTGLGVLLSVQRRLELQERRLLVVTQGAGLLKLLDAAGAAGSLLLFADVEQAIQEARRGPAPVLAA
ncbi:MAG TPA: STAS domain-containing protein [Armatimonadota bacterium]|nr:STAS domain-containing protein [Armatimonadota bacterium]